MSTTVFEASYELNEIDALDSDIADVLDELVGPNQYTTIYSVSEDHLKELLQDGSDLSEKEEKTIKALLERLEDADGPIDLAF